MHYFQLFYLILKMMLKVSLKVKRGQTNEVYYHVHGSIRHFQLALLKLYNNLQHYCHCTETKYIYQTYHQRFFHLKYSNLLEYKALVILYHEDKHASLDLFFPL